MNLLLESPTSVPYFTDVGAMLRAMGVAPIEFDWYISDIDTNIFVPGIPASDGWFTGSELASVLSHADLQFVWGVFSAVPPGMRFDVERSPGADGNSRYWQDDGTLAPELDGAVFELICWDSSATILIGITAEQARRFIQAYPEVKPLNMAATDPWRFG
ncbi:MAG: hypothetical protein EOP37_15210 [Rubrivivax sp.]|nr:MAG: hypothetical protein EOP37_15210 [Rubrivivax sp.]